MQTALTKPAARRSAVQSPPRFISFFIPAKPHPHFIAFFIPAKPHPNFIAFFIPAFSFPLRAGEAAEAGLSFSRSGGKSEGGRAKKFSRFLVIPLAEFSIFAV